jgi:SAM-dependent methyltransferase
VSAKEQVRAYWEADPCGAKLAAAERGSPEFFAEVEQKRYELEPFVLDFAQFERWRGRRVLEIGVGLGSDFVRFARAGAVATGVDLTDAAVELVRTRVGQEGLEADVRRADAEELPFADGSFDLVYSWGVLHHTPDPAVALAEVRRVLAPGGEARIMLYTRRSWFAFGVWVRAALLRGRPRQSLARAIAAAVESPGTKAYTSAELRELFAGFGSVELVRFLTPYDRRVAGPLARLTGRRLGWFVGIVAR